ncbi:MAG: peptidase M16 [Coxiella sp. RIFCSPHIGHO2_12_FULL_44_14]|nr:MAG: peptidase M16 [Coxiella sp. RIFCSPHIGHO2_12_FULL_44_14]
MGKNSLFTCRLFYFSLLSIVVLTTTGAASSSVLPIQHWVTSKGAHVYFIKSTEIPMLDIQVVFAAGSAYDGKTWGIASLVNSLLNEGTHQQTADQIADSLNNVGAQMSNEVNRDMALIRLRTLVKPDYLSTALKTLTSVLSEPSFSTDALTRVRRLTLAAIQQQQQMPSSVASNAFYQAIYQHHPYAHPTLGTVDTIRTLTRADVEKFYSRYYVARNAAVIMVGDITRSHAQTLANQLINALPEGTPAPLLTTASNPAKAVQQSITFPSQQTTIMLGQLGITPNDPYYFPLMVGNHILGAASLVSILFEQVRNERGLAYSITSQFIPRQYRGPFFIVLQTRVDQTREALHWVQYLLKKFVDEGPSQTDLVAAKENLIGGFPLALATNQSMLAEMTRLAFYHQPLNYWDTYRQRIEAVQATDIKKAFQATLHPDQMTLITVGKQ